MNISIRKKFDRLINKRKVRGSEMRQKASRNGQRTISRNTQGTRNILTKSNVIFIPKLYQKVQLIINIIKIEK